MPTLRLVLFTSLAMIAFAGNSLLCRVALSTTEIDPASFTIIRILSGAIILYALVFLSQKTRAVGGNWLSSIALFGYAAGFSFAYLSLSAATGALLLFGAVQATMIGYGLFKGERINIAQTTGVVIAIAGLIGLLLPGLSAPPILGAMLMLGAGVWWGIYSLRGRGITDPTSETAGNFIRAVPFGLLLMVGWWQTANIDPSGVGFAIASGALASGLGYAIWYSVLPALNATTAATVQLTVPALTAAGGVFFIGEHFTLRLVLASTAILGGVAIYLLSNGRKNVRNDTSTVSDQPTPP